MGVQDGRLLKVREGTEGQFTKLYTVVMSLCDTEMKNQVKALEGYKELTKNSFNDIDEGNQENSIYWWE